MLRYLKFNQRLHYFLIVWLAVAVFITWSAVGVLIKDLWPKVAVLEVGQGDAILIRTPGNVDILIDGGPSQAGLLGELKGLRPFWDKKIEVVVITHPDFDHINGLRGIFQNFEIEKVFLTGVFHSTKSYQRLLRALEQEGSRVFLAQAGQELTLPGLAVQFQIIAPFEELTYQQASSLNNTGIVSILNLGERNFLFSADIEKKQELNIIRHINLSPVTALKVAHHGSKSSSSQAFLKQIKPALAVISAGKDNPYNHPHQATLEKLQLIPVWQTAKQGSVIFYTDGRRLWIDSSRQGIM